MRRAPSMMSGLAEHCAELGRPTLGDVPMAITVTGLISARHEAGVARDVLGTREALDIREHCQSGEGNDWPDAGHRLEPTDIVAERARQVSEKMIDGPDLLACQLRHRVVETGMGLEFRLDGEGVDQTIPTARIPQTAPRPHESTRSVQQALGGIDLGGLNSDEVATTGQRRSQRTDRWTRNVDDRTINIPADPVTQLKGVTPITLLAGAARLDTNFVGIDDDRLQAERAQRARHVEGRCSGFQRDRSSWWELILMADPCEGLGRRGHRTAPDDRPCFVLDHEHCVSTVNIEANVVGSHRAVLPGAE